MVFLKDIGGVSAPLLILQEVKIQHALLHGVEMFISIPDFWFEPVLLRGCGNGHVSGAILKSENRGALCLECNQPVLAIPPYYNDTLLKVDLKKVREDVINKDMKLIEIYRKIMYNNQKIGRN